MVSVLWKACSEGDLENVQELLKEASSVDIEIKDHAGVTPLIEAIKNGHLEIVRALLDKGADPTNGSRQGQPQQYTSDSSILELLNNAQSKTASSGIPTHESTYTRDANGDPEKHYYGPPPLSYMYYPGINSGPPLIPDGGVYYSQPPPPSAPQTTGENHVSGGIGNLPPPDVARFIPCRYFPACRYGSSCLFAHPQTPYFQGSLPPPAQYAPPYDPINAQPYVPNYYAPTFQPPNGAHHVTPLSPPSMPHVGHGPSPSEVPLQAQPHFSPNGVPPPSPYGPMTPSAYPHSGQVPAPMSAPPLPPLHLQSPLLPPGPQSPTNMYNPATPPALPYTVQQDATIQYPLPQPVNVPANYQDLNGGPKSPPSNSPSDAFGTGPTHPTHREGMGHTRRGTGRRGSFASRKPPCLFFPAGRCKNGDDCRFPHVMPEGPGPHTPYFSGRGGGPRPRHINGNGFATINEKPPGMAVRDDPRLQNGTDGLNRSNSADPARPRYSQGVKNNHVTNGVRVDKRSPTTKQRVPNPDEFPVLAGSTTPPSRSPGLNGVLSNGNGHTAPTAAQVLQAPPPVRKDSVRESSTRGTTPDPVRPITAKDINGETNDIVSDTTTTHDQLVNKLPMSFAAMATGTPDLPKEVVLSA